MFDGKPMSERIKHVRNVIAERTLKRGRRTTAAEALANIQAFLAEGETLGEKCEGGTDVHR